MFGKDAVAKEVVTDEQGNARLSGFVNLNPVLMRFSATGFYGDSGREFNFLPNSKRGDAEDLLQKVAEQGFWSTPESPIEISLKRKGHARKLVSRKISFPMRKFSGKEKWLDLETGAITNTLPSHFLEKYIRIEVEWNGERSEFPTNVIYSAKLRGALPGSKFVMSSVDAFSEYKYPLRLPKEGYQDLLEIFESASNGQTVASNSIRDGIVAILKIDMEDGLLSCVLIRSAFVFGSTFYLNYVLFPPLMDDRIEFEPVSESRYEFEKSKGNIIDDYTKYKQSLQAQPCVKTPDSLESKE